MFADSQSTSSPFIQIFSVGVMGIVVLFRTFGRWRLAGCGVWSGWGVGGCGSEGSRVGGLVSLPRPAR